ncbi:hypothetical protein [Paraburkholderia sp. J41]|nr:hypothetical protein [Paraburkholderia sp. J41]
MKEFFHLTNGEVEGLIVMALLAVAPTAIWWSEKFGTDAKN